MVGCGSRIPRLSAHPPLMKMSYGWKKTPEIINISNTNRDIMLRRVRKGKGGRERQRERGGVHSISYIGR